MNPTSRRIAAPIQVGAVALSLLYCGKAACEPLEPDEPEALEASATVVLPAAAAAALAQSFRGRRGAKEPPKLRTGMHVVVRVAVVDMVAHPDSADVRLALRSKLLKGSSVAKSQLALAVVWRF